MAFDLFIAKAHPPIGEYPLGNIGPSIHLFFFIFHKIDLNADGSSIESVSIEVDNFKLN